MSGTAWIWLFFNFLSIIFLAFFSMTEMACVSFNKVRLHYYVSKENKRAIWLNYLLHHPFRLFGTTLIGVNIAMFTGSECAREFHSAIGINPDYAPLSQVILVIIFGELAPMFAARHYAEHVAMLGAPILYVFAKIMTPVLGFLGMITKGVNFFIPSKKHKNTFFLSQDELKKILETQDTDFNQITTNIFDLRNKEALQVATPIHSFPSISSNATIEEMKKVLANSSAPYIPVYFKDTRNIVGIAFPRDLIRIPETRRVRDYARAPWFVTEHTKISQILHQFRINNQIVAIVLDNRGKSVGLITIDDIIDEIFE